MKFPTKWYSMDTRTAIYTLARIRYKETLAIWHRRIAHYYNNYYFTDPSGDLDFLLEDGMVLINTAMKRNYLAFIRDRGSGLKDSMENLLAIRTKLRKYDGSFFEVVKTCSELGDYLEGRLLA